MPEEIAKTEHQPGTAGPVDVVSEGTSSTTEAAPTAPQVDAAPAQEPVSPEPAPRSLLAELKHFWLETDWTGARV